jgi:hypothetical protein
MKNLLSKIIKFLNQLDGLLPSRNPIGRSEFDSFANSIFLLYDIPNLVTYRSALCAMVLQDKRLYRSKFSFALAIRKAQANQTAYELMSEIRQQEKNGQETQKSV